MYSMQRYQKKDTDSLVDSTNDSVFSSKDAASEPSVGVREPPIKTPSKLNRKKLTRKRAKKPIDAPRRPKSAYMFFLAEFREKWKEEFPEQRRVSAVAQAAGEKWRSMTANEKRRFEDLSQNSKTVYRKEMAEYVSNRKQTTNGNDEQNQRSHEEIRRPASAYFFFLQTFRAAFEREHPDVVLSASEMSQMTTEKWRSMTPEEKSPYQEMSHFSRQEYHRIKSMSNMERIASAAAFALNTEGLND